jgi:hypothetical protein
MIGAAYALRPLEAAESSTDQVTAAVTECQLKSDPDRDFLNETSWRPPIEARPFTTATRALRALRYYRTNSRTGAVNDRARSFAPGWPRAASSAPRTACSGSRV